MGGTSRSSPLATPSSTIARTPTPSSFQLTRWAVSSGLSNISLVPAVAPAFSDSRTFRAAFPELVAYGFFPHRHATVHETEPLVHSANERIDVRDLGFAAACYADVTRRLLG